MHQKAGQAMAGGEAVWRTADEAQAVNYRLWLLAILGGLLALRIAALYFARTDLFFDEAQYWFWSTEPAFGYYSKPPLIAWAIGASTAICGTSEFCIRLPSPIFHTGTALLIFAAAGRLYGQRTGFWAAIAYATLPAVSLSSGLISTDVPLLFFWAGALLSLLILMQTGSWTAAAGLGLAFGFGALSKYAMVYFLLGLAVYAVFSGEGRALWRTGKFYASLAIAALIIAPNIAWNVSNQFATFSHTADNARLDGPLFNFGNLVEFLGGQFGVMGPVLFTALIIVAIQSLKKRPKESDLLLLCLSFPIIILICGQAFLSRAHANWAASAYVAATILVIAAMLRQNARKALAASFIVHGALAVLFPAASVFAPQISLPAGANPFERVLGWQEMGRAVQDLANAHGARAIVADKRSVAAELNYYARGSVPVKAWITPGARPNDHFEMRHPATAETPAPVLFVSAKDRVSCPAEHYRTVEPLGERAFPTGPTAERRLWFYLMREPDPAAFAAPREQKPGCR